MDLERGMLGSIPYAALGAGRPVLVLAGLMPTTGVAHDGTVKGVAGPVLPLAASRRVVVTNRRPGLPRGMTMAELAAEHADAVRAGFGEPVDVLGVSTGGSIAQQLAADHPDVVRRLVVGSSACRLGDYARSTQARVAALVRAGRIRTSCAVMAAALVPRWRGRSAARALAYALGPTLLRDRQGLDDMATTIEAEDAFDLARCATPITVPTLVVGGGRDRFYEPELFAETVRLVPGSRLSFHPDKGHVGVLADPRARAAIAGFLGAA